MEGSNIWILGSDSRSGTPRFERQGSEKALTLKVLPWNAMIFVLWHASAHASAHASTHASTHAAPNP
jgi:hypothetical protein